MKFLTARTIPVLAARTMKRSLSVALILALPWTALWADAGPDQKHVEKIRQRVAASVQHPRRVSVETYDGRRLQGSIIEAGPDSFTLTNDGRSMNLVYSDVKSIDWRSPVSRQLGGVLIAAMVLGVLVGLVALVGGFKG